MKKIVMLFIMIIITSFVYFGVKNINNISNKPNDNNQEIKQNNDDKYNKVLELLRKIDGLEIKSAILENEPVGIKAFIEAPKETVVKGVEYFLEGNKNFSEINIITKDGYLDIFTKYNLNGMITPIKAKLYIGLDEAKNLILNIKDLKFLDINISDWIVDFGLTTFCKDIFSSNKNLNISIDKGNIIIYKDNFKKFSLNDILIKEDVLELYIFINLEEILKG